MKYTLSMRNYFFKLSSHLVVLLHVRCSNVSSTSVRTLLFYYTFDAQLFLLYGSVYHETSVCSLIHSNTHLLEEPSERISIDVGDEGAQFSTPCLLLYYPPVPFGLHELIQSDFRWLRISLTTSVWTEWPDGGEGDIRNYSGDGGRYTIWRLLLRVSIHGSTFGGLSVVELRCNM
jgi:hypothetical protein